MPENGLDLEGWYLHGEFDDDYWDPLDDEGDDDWELWEHDHGDPCLDCGPWCEAWLGDGLCQHEIDAQAYEYWRENHPVRCWLRDEWHGLTAWLRYQLRRPGAWLLAICPICKQPERIFGKAVGDHADCLPF